jgi:hypothetical protein
MRLADLSEVEGKNHIMLTPKQRLLRALRCQKVDRVPWAPFLAYWWESQPAEVQAKGQIEVLRAMGADPLLRGFPGPYRVIHSNCQERSWVEGKRRITELETTAGCLRWVHVYSSHGNTWFLWEHPLKTEGDFRIFEAYLDDIRIEPDYELLANAMAEHGENALLLPLVGLFMKTGFQSMLEHWVGTEELVYALADFPETVLDVLGRLRYLDVLTVKIAARSPGEAFIFWEDTSTTNISPKWFRAYVAPAIQEWAEILHANGKLLVHHACGHMRALLPVEAELGIDAIDSLTPPPTGDVELWEARNVLGQDVCIIGGIDPVVFLNSTLAELEAYVCRLVSRIPPEGLIVANSDSCPPGVSFDKFRLVGQILREVAD